MTAQLHQDDRADPRYGVDLDATVRLTSADPQTVLIENLSGTGFLIRGAARLAIGDRLTIGFGGLGVMVAHVLRQEQDRYGCRFVRPLSRRALAQALLDQERLVHLSVGHALPSPNSLEPEVEKFTLRTRLAILSAATAGSWLVVGLVASIFV